MKNFKRITILFLLLVSGFFGLKNAKAIEYEMLGGKPANPDPSVENSSSWFIYKLSQGEVKEDAIEVANLYEKSWEALIYAADTTKSSSGGFALKQFSEPKTEVGSWVRFYPNDPPKVFQGLFEENGKKILSLCTMSREELKDKIGEKNLLENSLTDLGTWCIGEESVKRELKSKERFNIPFIIKIPENADAGEHTGGILIQKANPETQENGSGSSIKLTTRVGVRIYETVPGEVIRKLEIKNFKIIKNFKEFSFTDLFGKLKKPQEYLVQTTTENSGNVSIDQAETIHIKNLLFGRRSEDINRNFQVMKRDSFISNYSWRNPRFGWLAFSTEIKYKNSAGNDEILKSETIKMWIIPWREITITAILFLLFFAGYYFRKWYQKKRYGGIGWVEYAVKQGENIMSLAEKFKVDWKILAKTNKLKAPYLLNIGQNVVVPPTGEEVNFEPIKPELENIFEEKKEIPEEKKEEMKNEVVLSKNVSEIAANNQPENLDSNSNEKNNSKDQIIEKIFSSKQESISADQGPKSGSKKIKWIVAGLMIIALVIILFFAWDYWKKSKEKQLNQQLSIHNISVSASEDNNGEETAQIENKESGDEEVSVEKKKSDLAINILNGGAVPGSAGKVKKLLEKNEYVKIEAKNAQKNDYSGIIVYYSEGLIKQAEELKKILDSGYDSVELKEADNEESKSSDITVILGK